MNGDLKVVYQDTAKYHKIKMAVKLLRFSDESYTIELVRSHPENCRNWIYPKTREQAHRIFSDIIHALDNLETVFNNQERKTT